MTSRGRHDPAHETDDRALDVGQPHAGDRDEPLPFASDPRDLTPIQVAELLASADVMRRLAIMRVLHQTRGNEFVQRVIAAEANPQVKKGDPISASILVRRVESGEGSLRIEGTQAFRQRIAQELIRIATTHTGRAVLEELLSAPTLTVITYKPLKAEMQRGGTISFDPGHQIRVVGANGRPIESPASTTLLHELVHATHDKREEGIAAGPPVRHRDYHNAEEEHTIAGRPTPALAPPPWSSAPVIATSTPLELTENAYRAEIGAPARFGHTGQPAPANQEYDATIAGFQGLEQWVADEDAEYDYGLEAIDDICDRMLAAQQYYQTAAQIEALREKARAKQQMIWELAR